GLNALAEGNGNEDDIETDPYADLLADLRSGAPTAQQPVYEVTLLGRWSAGESSAAPSVQPRAASSTAVAVPTPLAAGVLRVDVEDAAGARVVHVDAVAPGRRYIVGKDPSCDIVVDGVYASRRHCELWRDAGAWWVADAGSTNGIRVESAGSVLRAESEHASPLELRPG